MLLIIRILLEISLNFTSSTVCPLLPRQLSQTLKCLFHSHSRGLSDKLETFSPPPSSVSLLSHVTKTWGICAWAVVEDDTTAGHRQTCQHRLFPPFWPFLEHLWGQRRSLKTKTASTHKNSTMYSKHFLRRGSHGWVCLSYFFCKIFGCVLALSYFSITPSFLFWNDKSGLVLMCISVKLDCTQFRLFILGLYKRYKSVIPEKKTKLHKV